MKIRPWVPPVVGFALLLALAAGSGYWVRRRARTIHDEMIEAHATYVRAEVLLQRLTRNTYIGELLVRNYLVGVPSDTGTYQQQMATLLDSVRHDLHGLEPELDDSERVELERLKAEVDGYWAIASPVFQWSARERKELGPQFLVEHVLPHWKNVVSLADHLTKLNEDDLRRDQQRLEASQNSFQRFLDMQLWLTTILGVVVAALGTHRFIRMEAREDLNRRKLEHAHSALRTLSRRLVSAQEAERKFISRELHDAVGQTLTAVGLELGSLESVRATPQAFTERVSQIKQLNSESLSVIRDISMGLRPSMLDDMGLRPALEWHIRQISRRSSIPVTLEFSGEPDELPESQRTCVYRAVQEALTNCVRHAEARNIRVQVRVEPKMLTAIVEDDGVGFDLADEQRKGIGLLGIEERVEELGGHLSIVTGKGKGTKLSLLLPIAQGAV